MRGRNAWIRVTTLATVVIAGLSSYADAQFRKGFTQQKFEVALVRKQPPKVYLMQTDIAVRATAQPSAAGAQRLTQQLASSLQTQLTSNDPRLKPAVDAATIISCAIGHLETGSQWADRKVTVRKKTGEKQVWNAKKGKYDTEPVYTDVEEIQRIQTVNGALSLSYQAADKSGAVLDSDTINATFSEDFVNGTNAPTQAAVEQSLVQRAVARIVPRLVPTTERLTVMLGRPNDEVDNLNKMAETGLWSRMLQQLETMKPLSDPKKEAYRVFNIGVANEAMAYQTDDIAVAKKMLQQAALQYNKAFDMKPDEKYFRDPLTRIESGIAAYTTLEQQQAQYAQLVKDAEARRAAEKEAAVQRASAEASGGRALGGAKPESTAMTNADVIDLVKSGLDKTNLVDAIKSAPAVAFDFSPAGLKQLMGGKVPNDVIPVMRARQQQASGTKNAPVAKKPAAPVKKDPTASTKK